MNGQSMEPTIANDQRLLLDDNNSVINDINRNDIIQFEAPKSAGCPEGAGCRLIKRVIGLPGETLMVVGNEIMIGEEVVSLGGGGWLFADDRMTLGANKFFVVGDNLDHSSDSRMWGPIERADIVGKVIIPKQETK